MAPFLREHMVPMGWATGLHVALAALLTVSFALSRPPIVPPQISIKARVIDESAIRTEKDRQLEADRAAQRRREEQAAQERREAEREQQRLDQLAGPAGTGRRDRTPATACAGAGTQAGCGAGATAQGGSGGRGATQGGRCGRGEAQGGGGGRGAGDSRRNVRPRRNARPSNAANKMKQPTTGRAGVGPGPGTGGRGIAPSGRTLGRTRAIHRVDPAAGDAQLDPPAAKPARV